MANNVEAQKKGRKTLRSAVTRYSNELQGILDADPVNAEEAQTIWIILSQKYEELRATDVIIYAALLEDGDVEEQTLNTEYDECDNYIRKFTRMKVKYERMMEDPASRHNHSHDDTSTAYRSVNQQPGRRKFKLPVIEFKQFNGELKEWLSFWAHFKKIHEDNSLDENDKISYLRQATEPDSRARQLVDSFPAIAGNYAKIVDSLKTRFGREDLQIEVYVRGLLRLILTNATSTSKIDIVSLYDEIETQLRALDTLGITSDKCSAIIFPLIESCLPEDVLRVWQRSPNAAYNVTDNVASLEDRLRRLMSFLKAEVENEQRISLAAEGFGIRSMANASKIEVGRKSDRPGRVEAQKLSNIPTAAGLVNSGVNKCLFCMGSHESATCFKAQKMSMDQKKKMLTEKRVCYCCLKGGHISRKCTARLKCILCEKNHIVLMCPNLDKHRRVGEAPAETEVKTNKADHTLSSHSESEVLLQTLRVDLETANGLRSVRVLIDSGSQRSYILKSTAELLGYDSKRKETINHGLFGGSQMTQVHKCYDVKLVTNTCTQTMEVLDQPQICQGVPSVAHGPWVEELRILGIQTRDTKTPGPIEILIGADFAGALYTGRRKVLKCGLVAMETILGWTLLGKTRTNVSRADTTFSGLVKDAPITDLWNLDVLGIMDPIEKRSREESALDAQRFFSDTVVMNDEGRYEVRLPWLSDHPPLPSNFEQAKKRLETTLRKLHDIHLHKEYDAIFKLWLSEGIIEEVIESEPRGGHYLPHRPVIKDHSTTRIRPVFDASARSRNDPSLNQCLEKGVNLIEQIPTILLRFREYKIGVISDIRKAFLQISICEEDRDFLKFLWVEPDGTQRVYRHRRVVFGINSSPFLLEATINHHLMKSLNKCEHGNVHYTRDTVERLNKSFYVDNCCTSVPNEGALAQFEKEARIVMAEASFDLRGWEANYPTSREPRIVSVLGLGWHLEKDVLTINMDLLQKVIDWEGEITKRSILSTAQQLFDPIGFVCPTTLVPKLLLQQLWEKKLSWDEAVDEQTAKAFRKWIAELSSLTTVEIPRWIGFTLSDTKWSLHTFCDASEKAFSAVVFLRIVQERQVMIRLLASKSRVAPLKKITIPRLELLAATIGARLYANVRNNISGEGCCYFWSVSSTVLSWIRRTEEWSVFVRNRVAEIRRLTSPGKWKHVSGVNNPADLPSRGCSPRQLLSSRWWEGPDWLCQSEEMWPQETTELDEVEINGERVKKVIIHALNQSLLEEWHLTYFSKYDRIVRMAGWILRFVFNIKNHQQKRSGELKVEEINTAETFVLKLVQEESFHGENDKRLSTLNPFYDESGLIRLKSRVSRRHDNENFCFPIVLPAKHEIVGRLVFEMHVRSCHVGTQGLLSLLRERYWVLGGRREVKSIINKCVICKRQNARSFVVESPALPLDRVRDAVTFEVVGTDFAGPLYLKDGQKAWLSAGSWPDEADQKPFIVITEQNFLGTENAFERLNWPAIVESASAQRIKWRFNPPTAAWWGGFWERLIGVLKKTLRKVLGRASLTYEELQTLLCDCESIMNARPLTYVSNDHNELMPLTPSMFLRDQAYSGIPDCDEVDRASLDRRLKYKQKLREDLRHRFRNEYLGQLKLVSRKSSGRSITMGEVVLIGNDNDKRLDWPLGRVVELMRGPDNRVRLVRVATAKGQLLRPVQRLYPLECLDSGEITESPVRQDEDERLKNLDSSETPCDVSANSSSAGVSNVSSDVQSRVPVSAVKTTRSGRITKLPTRFY